MRDFTPEEAERHNALTDKAWSLTQGEMLLDEPHPVGAPNWFVKRKLQKAIRYFEQALEINPAGWQSMWAIGKIHQRLGCPEAAFLWFNRAHQVNPQQTDVAREAGLAALDLGKSKEALYLCKAAVQLAPDDAGLVANLAWAHLISGDVALAQKSIQQALEANPEDDISKTVLQIIDEVASGVRPVPKTLLEISELH